MADIPGLIEGAAEGHGLGVRFLKHLSRTQLLLHLIDVLPIDQSDPVDSAVAIVNELRKHSEVLYEKERWLVLNKTDLLPADELDQHCADIIQRLHWDGPVFCVSAATGSGSLRLITAIMQHLEQQRESEQEAEARRLRNEAVVDSANPPDKPAADA